jgi:hypothetical protein
VFKHGGFLLILAGVSARGRRPGRSA